jgi:hypothetical protein
MARKPLSRGEISPHKVAAIFDDAEQARRAADGVRAALALPGPHVQVITPDSQRPGRQLEPESHGIFSVMMKAHAALGVAGFLGGLLLFWLLWQRHQPFIVSNPWAAAGAIVFFATMGGLMLGGLVTLRPDHDGYILGVLEACRDGRSAAVVHARTTEELEAASACLGSAGGQLLSTL